MSEIKKPLSVVRQEFIDNITNLVVDSGLPAFAIEDVLKDILQQVHVASVKQYEEEKLKYEAQIKEQDN